MTYRLAHGYLTEDQASFQQYTLTTSTFTAAVGTHAEVAFPVN